MDKLKLFGRISILAFILFLAVVIILLKKIKPYDNVRKNGRLRMTGFRRWERTTRLMLGHSNISTTSIYVHSSFEQMQAAANRLKYD